MNGGQPAPHDPRLACRGRAVRPEASGLARSRSTTAGARPGPAFVLELKLAKGILLLAEVVNAELAMQIVIVNRVVSDEEFDAKAARIASRIANLKAEMVVANKRLASSRGERTGFATGFRILRRFAWSCG